MLTLGAIARPQLPPERLRALSRAAQDAGLAQLWVWEDCFLSGGVATTAAALAWTERLRVGIGVLPVPLRTVTLTAMEVATLLRLFPDRVVLGFGHGVQDWMGQAGARVESPLTLLREYLVALRALLGGERVTTAGRYVTLDDVALDWPPAAPPPLLVGSTGAKTLVLAGEVADGVVLSAGSTPDDVRRARRLLDEGRTAAGRDDRPAVVVNLHTAVAVGTGSDATERLHAELRRWYGRTDAERGVAGDAGDVAAAVTALADAGADTVVLEPTPDEPDPEGFVRFAAEEVAPLLRST